MTDDVVEMLRDLPPQAIGPGEPFDRFELVRARVQRRRRVRAAWTGLATVVVAVVVVVLVLPQSAARTVQPTRPVPRLGATPTCPKAFTGSNLWVPDFAVGVDGESQLVPSATPSRALVCYYRQTSTSRGLTGERELTGGLAQLATDLSWLPHKLRGQDHPCTLVGSTVLDSYLVGLSYPGGGTIWVSTQREPNDCLGTSNGQYLSMANLGHQVGASYLARAWVPGPPEPGADTTRPCTTPMRGRRGQEVALVPPGPVSLRVCQLGSDSNTVVHQWEVTTGFDGLVSLLDGLPTKPSSWSADCAVAAKGNSGPSYEMRFHYAFGPDVHLRLQPGCQPEVDNFNLASDGGDAALTALQQLVKGAR